MSDKFVFNGDKKEEPSPDFTMYCKNCGTKLDDKNSCHECKANFEKAYEEQWKSVAVKVNIQLAEEVVRLRADKARLVEALKQTDEKMMASDAWVGSGSLNAANIKQHKENEQLLTEMDEK